MKNPYFSMALDKNPENVVKKTHTYLRYQHTWHKENYAFIRTAEPLQGESSFIAMNIRSASFQGVPSI